MAVDYVPTGVVLKVTDKEGKSMSPVYEAYGWQKINEIIQGTLAIEHVAKVEIEWVGIKLTGDSMVA